MNYSFWKKLFRSDRHISCHSLLISLFLLDNLSGQSQICGYEEPALLEFSTFTIEDQTFCNSAYLDDINNGVVFTEDEYVIPVVVHVIVDDLLLDESDQDIHAEDVSDAQVINAINITNRYLFGMDGGGNIVGLDTKVRLRLATIDPQGNPTTGILHESITSSCALSWGLTTSECFNGGDIHSTYGWNEESYLNLYIVDKIFGVGSLDVIGFAQQGGYICLIDENFSICDAMDLSNSKTLVHELGHYLSLVHTNNGAQPCHSNAPSTCVVLGDKVCDTERHDSSFPPDNSYEFHPSDCGLDPLEAWPIYNQMSYAHLTRNTFTYGQIFKMHSFLNCGNVPVIWADENLVETGTGDPYFSEGYNINIQFSNISLPTACSSDGSFDVTISNGTAPYSIKWYNNDNLEIDVDDPLHPSGLGAGKYTIRATDADCIFSWGLIYLSGIPPIEVSQSAVCRNEGYGCIPAIENAELPVNILWNTGETSSCISVQSTDTYSYTLTDQSGCTYNGSVYIMIDSYLITTYDLMGSSCTGSCDGSATAIVSDGVPPFSYVWTTNILDPDPLVLPSTTSTQGNLCPGFVAVEVYDAQNCYGGVAFEVPSIGSDVFAYIDADGDGFGTGELLATCDPLVGFSYIDGDCDDLNFDVTVLEASILVLSNVTCPESLDGSVTLDIVGGSAPYTILWDGIESNNTTQNDLSSGSHEALVTASEGCSVSVEFMIEETPYDYPVEFYYNGENWSNQTITFGGNVIIPTGDWPTFENVTFVFAAGTRLIIQEGAIAYFISCNFTACASNWWGIWVQSFGNGVGAGPGNFFMDGGSIKYAEIGIMNPDIYVWEGPYESGIVQCTNVLFENNRTAVKAEKVGQADDDNFVGPFAYWECTFIVNDEYNLHFTQPFQQHAYLHLVKGNGFKSCTFKNDMSNGTWAERGKAIYAVDARFDVDDIDENGNDAGLSSFEGFDIAVYNHVLMDNTTA